MGVGTTCAHAHFCCPCLALPCLAMAYLLQLASKFADTRSIGAGRYGGACTAAAFLQKFVEDDVAWCADTHCYQGSGHALLNTPRRRCCCSTGLTWTLPALLWLLVMAPKRVAQALEHNCWQSTLSPWLRPNRRLGSAGVVI